MDNSKPKGYLSFLTTALQYQGSYHNHKETMAWVITALYVPSILTLGFSLSKKSLECWIISIIFGLALILTITFVIKQLQLRSLAADTCLALTRLINEYSKNPSRIPLCTSFQKGKQWPQFIQDEIEHCKGKGRSRCTFICTDVMLCIAIILSSIGGGILSCGLSR
jgi:hypothetical protein